MVLGACGNSSVNIVDVDVTMSKTDYSVVAGDKVELSVNNNSNYQVHWSASNLKVVNVISKGNNADVIGLSQGTAIVYATVLDKTLKATVNVLPKEEIDSDVDFSLNFEALSLYLNQNAIVQGQISVGGKLQDTVLIFESLDTSVADIAADGTITPVALGQTYIKVSTNYQGKNYSKNVLISVIDNVLVTFSDVSIEMDALTDGTFSTKQIFCTVYENGEAVDNPSLTWQSIDTNICEVDENGLISAVSAGETTVTVKYEKDDKSYSGCCLVKINHNKVNIITSEKVYIDLREKVENNISLSLFDEMNDEKILFAKNSIGQKWDINDSKLNLDTTKLIVGYNQYRFYSATKEFVVSLYTADRVIRSGDEFIDMLEEETVVYDVFNSQVLPTYQKTFVLGNDITLKDTKRKDETLYNQGIYYGYSSKHGINYFLDIFDGDGHKITSQDKNATNDAGKRYIWTNGLFGFMANATVKNLIVENALLVDAGFSAVGTIAQQVQGESVIENCVIINPTVKANGSNFSAGFLAGRIYNSENKKLIIKNNLIIDGQKNPNFISYNRKNSSGETVAEYYYGGENNSKFDGIADGVTVCAVCNFYAGIGDSAKNAKNTDIFDNLCLSANGYLNATNPNKVDGIWFEEERMPDGKVYDSISSMIEENTEALKNYALVKVAGNKIFIANNEIKFKKPDVLNDNDGNFNPDWIT